MERKNFKNKKLRCVDCNATFTFSADEQFFFWAKGLSEPKRCPECRAERKATINREGRRYV